MQKSGQVPPQIKIQDVMTLTARLAQLLAEEADLLGAMKLKEIEKLQAEKLYLTNAIDTQRKLIEKHPHLIDTIPSRDKHDMEALIEVFNNILAENHRKLLLAKEVNAKIVSAIKDVVKEHTVSKNYGGNGLSQSKPYENLSVTLDKVI